MKLIDTHTHIYLPEFENDRAEVKARALDAGVVTMVLPNVDATTLEPMQRLRASDPATFKMAIGLHPTEVNASWEEEVAKVRRELQENADSYVAVGEVGIDLYWDKTFREEQLRAFKEQCELAAEHSLPVIVHCREGLPEAIEVLKQLKEVPLCVFHSFGGSIDDVKSIREAGDFYFGINGIVTFKNSKLREVLPEIGLDRILLETDAPYLAPVPHRGKRNEPAYLTKIAESVAGALETDVEEVARATTRNAERFFGL